MFANRVFRFDSAMHKRYNPTSRNSKGTSDVPDDRGGRDCQEPPTAYGEGATTLNQSPSQHWKNSRLSLFEVVYPTLKPKAASGHPGRDPGVRLQICDLLPDVLLNEL